MLMLLRPRVVLPIALLVLCGVFLSCGGSNSSIPAQTIPNIAGAWEFIARSNNTGALTAIDVALQEGSTLSNGSPVPSGQISASSAQITFVSVAIVSQNINASGFGGGCQPITLSNNLGPGAVTAPSAPVSFTFTENGNVFNVSGTLSGDNQSVLNGTYTAQSGNTCSDTGGTITGNVVSKLTGTYNGKMCPLPGTLCASQQDFSDTVTSATLTENSSGSATLTLSLTGTDNATFTMTGPVTGNAFSVTGTFQGEPVEFFGYYEQVSHSGNTVATLYLVNASNPSVPIAILSSQS